MKKQTLELAARVENEEGFEMQSEFLRLLLNNQVTTFIFPRGLVRRENQEAGTALWESLIAEQPLDLTKLVTESPNMYDSRKWNVSALLKISLRSFRNLETLVVQGLDLKDVHFRLIGQNLPNLR